MKKTVDTALGAVLLWVGAWGTDTIFSKIDKKEGLNTIAIVLTMLFAILMRAYIKKKSSFFKKQTSEPSYFLPYSLLNYALLMLVLSLIGYMTSYSVYAIVQPLNLYHAFFLGIQSLALSGILLTVIILATGAYGSTVLVTGTTALLICVLTKRGNFATIAILLLVWILATLHTNLRALGRLETAGDGEEGEKAESGKADEAEAEEGSEGEEEHKDEMDGAEDEKEKKFFEWLKDDKPVRRPEQDYFGVHSQTARRIARRLRGKEGPASVVLYGPYGSGKTTVGHLARYYLRGDRLGELKKGMAEGVELYEGPVELVMVSAWGYEDARALMGGILETLTDALAPYGDVFPLKAVRRDYLRAVTGAGGALGAAAGWLSGFCGPRAVLERLDRACERAGVRLALWLDDLDRFTRNEKERASAGPILALLDLLKGCEHISHVLTVTDFGALGDPERLASHYEPLNLPTEISRSLFGGRIRDALADSGIRIVTEDGIRTEPIGKTTEVQDEPTVLGANNCDGVAELLDKLHISYKRVHKDVEQQIKNASTELSNPFTIQKPVKFRSILKGVAGLLQKHQSDIRSSVGGEIIGKIDDLLSQLQDTSQPTEDSVREIILPLLDFIGNNIRNIDITKIRTNLFRANHHALGFLLNPRKLKQVLKRMIDAESGHSNVLQNLSPEAKRNYRYGLLLLYTAEMEPGVIRNEFGEEETLAVFLRRTHQKVSGQVQSHAQNHPGEEEDFYRGRFRYCLKRAVEETLNVEQDTQRKSRLTRIFRLIYTLIELKGGYALLKEHYGE